MPSAAILFLFLMVRVGFAYTRAKRGGAGPVFHLRTIIWRLMYIAVALGMLAAPFVVLAAVGEVSRGRMSAWDAALVTAIALPVGAYGLAFLVPWRVLRPIALRGNYRAAYYVAHALLADQSAAEGYAPASFFAYLALAYRGDATREELDWIGRRFAKEKRALGMFGAAFALSQALEGKLAADRGDRKEADDFRTRARLLFGTVTYLSAAACPSHVKEVANEYLLLDAATRAEWGAAEAVLPAFQTPVVVAVRNWARENLMKRTEPRSSMSRRAAKLPITSALSTREPLQRDTSAEASFERMRSTYVALANGTPQSPRVTLELVAALDRFFDPRSPDCRLDPETRANEEAVAALADSIAGSVTALVRAEGIPIFVLDARGAISTRVHEKLETFVTNELRAALRAGCERADRKVRGTLHDEWLEVSRIRGLYRRVEHTLGSAAAGAFSGKMFHEYGKLGILLSETFPRRRPLAHAVFACLQRDAARFNIAEAAARELRNMKVTSRID